MSRRYIGEKAPLDAHPSLMSPPAHSSDVTPMGTTSLRDPSSMDRLHSMLAKAKITDDEIIAGVKLTDTGFQKASARLGCSVDEVRALFQTLASKLRQDRSREGEMLDELAGTDGDARFTFEPDFTGSVTVRDTKAGKKVFVRGGEGSHLLHQLEQSKRDPEAVQELLRRYAHLMENDDHLHAQALEDTGFWGEQGAGAIFLAKSTNRILIALRSESVEQPHTWGSWGGAIDSHEDPLKAAVREAEEEAGYTGGIDAAYPLFVFKKESFRYHNFLLVVEDEFQPHLNWENDGYRWCEFGEWPSPLHFGLHSLLGDKNSVETIIHVIQQNSAIGTLRESVLDEEDTFESEIAGPSNGSYNFPWRVGAKHGFGNARWSGRGENMKVTVQWAADSDGDQISDSKLLIAIEQQAIAFIGQE
jgi:8-oxo-dGTP pyrophosphatase MutT (NUDIX family)